MNYGDSFFLKKKNGGAKPIFPGDEVEITCVAVNSNFDIGLDWYLNNEPFNVDRIRSKQWTRVVLIAWLAIGHTG